MKFKLVELEDMKQCVILTKARFFFEIRFVSKAPSLFPFPKGPFARREEELVNHHQSQDKRHHQEGQGCLFTGAGCGNQRCLTHH